MRKHKKIPTRVGQHNALIDSLNERADSHNEFVDMCEHRFEGFKDAFNLLLDYLGKRDKQQRKTDWLLLAGIILNLAISGTLIGLKLSGVI